ncbi:hypothetical protein ACFVJM_37025 [Streptomyces virginiae]|uniref:hypothetical protein n=1 Tax=Streptomyces virginiae TaxID=1961 RepID=UPI00363C851B
MPLGPDQAAVRLGVRRCDFDQVVRRGWLAPFGSVEVDYKRQGGVTTVPLYDAQEIALLEVVHPCADWRAVHTTAAGCRSPLAVGVGARRTCSREEDQERLRSKSGAAKRLGFALLLQLFGFRRTAEEHGTDRGAPYVEQGGATPCAPDEHRSDGGRVQQRSRSARLAASALTLLVTVLALFVPVTGAHGMPMPADGPLAHHTVAGHTEQGAGPDDVPALHLAVTHRLDAQIPGPQPAGPARTAVDTAPHRVLGGPGTGPATALAPPRRPAESAAPRGPPHR